MNMYKLMLLIITIVSHYTYCSETNTIIMHTYNADYDYYTISLHTRSSTDLARIGLIQYSFTNKNLALLCKLKIKEKYQRRGFGTKLMNIAFKHMRNSGVQKATWASKESAIPFYEKYGAYREYSDSCAMIYDFKK